MLLNTIFFALIANSAFGDGNGIGERIVFERREIDNGNGRRRNGLERLWPFKPQETTITFVHESFGNEPDMNRPNQNAFMLSNHRKNNTFNPNSESIGSGNNNREWENNWQSFSTMNGNRRKPEKEKEGIFWSNPDRNNSLISSNNNRNQNKNGNSSKRKLLPESSCGIDLPRRILGGISTDIDEHPWLALMQYRDRNGNISHSCGGVLISTRYVITAAHCTIGLGVTSRKLKLEKVRLGEWDLNTDQDCQQEVCSDPLQDIGIEEIINHPSYKPRQASQTHDIALIRLRRKANINQFVQPICLPLDNVAKTNFEGRRLTVAGWGKTSNSKNSYSNLKMKVDVPVVSWDSCRSFYDSYYGNVKIANTQMCAGGEDGQDSCQGDSGGPLMSNEEVRQESRWFVVGIVSSGPAACGVEGRPSLYTKVTEYTDWILDNIRD